MNKTDLKEIKKGNIGTGLLIENDGWISKDISENNKRICEGMEGGEWHVPYPFIVDAVFQKFNIKNANGRIYPEAILKKQVEIYQQKIQEHRAYGECYRPEAMILTEMGWKELAKVKEGDNVLTLNTDTNKIEVKPILKKISHEFKGNLINICGDGINDLVTPGHEYVLFNDKNEFVGRWTAQQIMDGEVPYAKFKVIPRENDDDINLADIKCEEYAYEGDVMCVEVENHTWYVKDNNEEHWTSNCNHPAESTIDLGRISHNIIELHWEGNTLVGKMELNISEGFRRNGICSSFGDTVALLLLNGYKIGVSSRGVGSVVQRMGRYEVGDDFELICWDVVSDPSTNNAFISLDGEEGLAPWVENTEKSNSGSLISEKIEKIKNILNS